MRQDIKDTLARLRFERDKFRAMSTKHRKDVAALRKQGKFLEMIKAMDRMHEYARNASSWQTEIDRLKASYA